MVKGVPHAYSTLAANPVKMVASRWNQYVIMFQPLATRTPISRLDLHVSTLRTNGKLIAHTLGNVWGLLSTFLGIKSLTPSKHCKLAALAREVKVDAMGWSGM